MNTQISMQIPIFNRITPCKALCATIAIASTVCVVKNNNASHYIQPIQGVPLVSNISPPISTKKIPIIKNKGDEYVDAVKDHLSSKPLTESFFGTMFNGETAVVRCGIDILSLSGTKSSCFEKIRHHMERDVELRLSCCWKDEVMVHSPDEFMQAPYYTSIKITNYDVEKRVNATIDYLNSIGRKKEATILVAILDK